MTDIKLEEGKIYLTKRGNVVSDLAYNKFGDDEPENYTGTMVYSNGQHATANWLEDGTFLGDGFKPAGDGQANIVKEIIKLPESSDIVTGQSPELAAKLMAETANFNKKTKWHEVVLLVAAVTALLAAGKYLF